MQVVRDDGAVLPCALNATCAALVDAGILLRNMFGKLMAAGAAIRCLMLGEPLSNPFVHAAAVSVTLTKSGNLMLDPLSSEEKVSILW